MIYTKLHTRLWALLAQTPNHVATGRFLWKFKRSSQSWSLNMWPLSLNYFFLILDCIYKITASAFLLFFYKLSLVLSTSDACKYSRNTWNIDLVSAFQLLYFLSGCRFHTPVNQRRAASGGFTAKVQQFPFLVLCLLSSSVCCICCQNLWAELNIFLIPTKIHLQV